MAVIRDPVPAFPFFQPTSIEDAQALLRRYGADAWVLAGGLDSLAWVRDRVRRPEALVDLGNIPALKGVSESASGVVVGAMTTIAELSDHRTLRAKYPLLVEAAAAAAPQHGRSQGTVGGNVSQDTRCSYYREGLACFRAGGDVCHANAPEGTTREHAILHADRCVAVNGSDLAPALIALDAAMVIRTVDGRERIVAAEEYFVGPSTDITRMTILGAGDLLVAIRLPVEAAVAAPAFGAPRARCYFEKVRDEKAPDFALVSIALAATMSGSTIDRIRIAVNGVAARPLRLGAVESRVRGRQATAETAAAAGELAAAGATPLRDNGYKVALLRRLVTRAILSVV